MLVSLLQAWNDLLPMEVTLDGIVMCVRFLHPTKDPSIVVTPDGIVTLVISFASSKAPAIKRFSRPMILTGKPAILSGIVNFTALPEYLVIVMASPSLEYSKSPSCSA